MQQKVAFVELPVLNGVLPLASGYMEAMCRKSKDLSEACQFEYLSYCIKVPYDEILSGLSRVEADVYAFSCYVWNAGLVRRLLESLLPARRNSYFILGGPQVMHQASQYLRPEHENVFICNGEGERTFAGFLQSVVAGGGKFDAVNGLSFYRGGEIVTTPPEPRISDLSEIPSPFLEGVFAKTAYTMAVMETNRGCPFKCNYCYWGAATGARVYKYDEDRLRQELEWVSQSGAWQLIIVDANWGMLKRDVELSKYIVEQHKTHGAPMSVYFCGSKNTPERVAEISRIFHEAGLMACQSVALQTMSTEALARVDRANISTAAYASVQRALNEQAVPSFVELIWPLPGETIASFRHGISQLCEIGADSFFIYPLLLMNNVGLNAKRDEYELVTVPDPDPYSEAEIVVSTKEVDRAGFEYGLMYGYVVLGLYTLRGLWSTARYLSTNGIMGYEELFDAFLLWLERHPDHPWLKFCRRSIRCLENANYSNVGEMLHVVLHSDRDAVDRLIAEFVTAQPFWSDPAARFWFEIDVVNRPYVYRNTRIAKKVHLFTEIQVQVTPSGYEVSVPEKYADALRQQVHVQANGAAHSGRMWAVTHRRTQLPFMPAKPLHDHYMYCQDISMKIRGVLPIWQAIG